MEPTWSADGSAIYLGDSLEVVPALDLVDAIVSDPPYGLAFMGKDWDHGVPGVPFWAAFLDRVKPGGHLLAFGGTRTFHRLMVAIEDAGWEIRDCLGWLYGSGFPKSLDVSKAIDKAAGAERLKVPASGGLHKNPRLNDDGWRKIGDDGADMDGPEAVTCLARKWSGWGTALKPAWEPIILARKPLSGTVAANVERYGTGGLNIDGCRVGTTKDVPGAVKSGNPIMAESWLKKHGHGSGFGPRTMDQSGMRPDIGRWPANLIHDGSEEVLEVFPEAGGGKGTRGASSRIYGGGNGFTKATGEEVGYGDQGSAARFFYCAKASRAERDAGLEGLPLKDWKEAQGFRDNESTHLSPRAGAGRLSPLRNTHPTVKPLALMRYLVRLVTPPGGVVLDPFAGSGSTVVAAILEGFRAIGVDLGEEHVRIAAARATWAAEKVRKEAGLFGPMA